MELECAMSDELCETVDLEDARSIHHLLQGPCDPDRPDAMGRLPLIHAVGTGNIPVVKQLLEAGCSPNKVDGRGRNALHEAATSNCPNAPELVSLLLEAGADPNAEDLYRESPLMTACYWSGVEVVRLLAGHTQDVNYQNPSNLRAAMHYAAMRQGKDILTSLLEAGADPNIPDADSETPLIIATRSGSASLETVRVLVEGGCQVNDKGFMQYTALHWAVHGRQSRCTSLLLQNGAHVNARNCMEKTPLHTAASCDAALCADILLQSGASSDLYDCNGETALSLASRCGLVDVLQCLLLYNANIEGCRRNEDTSLIVAAIEKGHFAVAKLLIYCGCKVAPLWGKIGSLKVNLAGDQQKFTDLMENHILKVERLQHLCRLAARRVLGHDRQFLQNLSSLPNIPYALANYLRLPELELRLSDP